MSEHRRPGRPQIADPDGIARIAATLFAEHGYAGVSMDDIAVRSGVSRRTLFRHFANKADLVWRDFFVNYHRLAQRLEADDSAPGLAGLRAALREALAESDEAEDISRVRLRIIGASPEVFAAGVGALRDMTDGFAHHLARDGAIAQDGLEARALGQAITGCILESAVWWASGSDDAFVDVVDRALERLGAGLE
ncbi:TetR/AcrR family transcriptional regulator [Demequina soli]|uniref:TetR/AcrR family transcriptional regulator n=1 Tax=Demequina soli TaxID=1638987 RepID=UPI000782DBA2|nr:TetR/AcrR family transcriptional regulator [Demequina soli]